MGQLEVSQVPVSNGQQKQARGKKVSGQVAQAISALAAFAFPEIALLLLVTGCSPDINRPKPSPPPENKPFHDEFNGTSIDLTKYQLSNWANGAPFNNGWLPHLDSLDGNGHLLITLDDEPSHGYPYSSGEIRTKETYGYGSYYVRMMPTKGRGLMSGSFFLWGPSKDEIDIEFLGKDSSIVQFNYFIKGVGGHEHIINLGYDANTSIRGYGFNWYPDSIQFIANDAIVYTAKGNMPTEPGMIMMNLWAGDTSTTAWLGKKAQDLYLGKFSTAAKLGTFIYNGPYTATYDSVSYTPFQ